MILIEKMEVFGFEAAIRGMRNPMNSWDRSDSGVGCDTEGFCNRCVFTPNYDCISDPEFIVGFKDKELMMKLCEGGPVHSKFMRMINVTCDITAPLYWWKEFDTYKVGTVRNSCSTMRKICDKEFTIDDFSHEHLFGRPASTVLTKDTKFVDSMFMLERMVNTLNLARNGYLEIKDKNLGIAKRFWWQIIQLLPSSYNQKATVQMNYEVLKNMYRWRKDHKLDEWREFCKWIESLPMSELVTTPTKASGKEIDTIVADENAVFDPDKRVEKISYDKVEGESDATLSSSTESGRET